jgi:hypothetical protein
VGDNYHLLFSLIIIATLTHGLENLSPNFPPFFPNCFSAFAHLFLVSICSQNDDKAISLLTLSLLALFLALVFF